MSDLVAPDPRAVVIVDGYSSGSLLAPELKKRGFGRARQGGALIHVQSTDPIIDAIKDTYNPHDYDEHIVHETLDETVRDLRAFSPAALLVGCETGVMLADQMSEALGLRTNGTRLSQARRDKNLMTETIRRAGIEALRQALVTNADEAITFQRSIGQWPIVVKPRQSSATDGLSVCHTDDELRRAISRVVGHANILGEVNHDALVQEYIACDEYIVNTVSRDGVVAVSDIWLYHKRDVRTDSGIARVYDRVDLLPREGEAQSVLVSYGTRVLTALEIQNGPAHIEIMLCDRGPILIEVGARPMGAHMTTPVSLCTAGKSQIERTVDAYLFPDVFANDARDAYLLTNQATAVFLVSKGGTVRDGFLKAVRSLPSYHHDVLHVTDGATLPVTIDLFSSPGAVVLIHHDRNQLEADYQALQKIVSEYFV